MQTLRLVLLVCILVMAFTGARSAAKTETTTTASHVRIVPVGIYGKALDDANLVVEDFRSISGGKSIADHFHGASASEIPYGIYVLRARVPGFWSNERLVRVFQPDVVAVIDLAVGVDGGPQNSAVSGRIRTAKRGPASIRARLCGTYGDTTIDTELNSSGEFSVAEVPNGSYILIIMSSDAVLKAQPIRVPVSAPIDIDLADPSQ